MIPVRPVKAVRAAHRTSHSDGRTRAVARTSKRRSAAARNVSASAVSGDDGPGDKCGLTAREETIDREIDPQPVLSQGSYTDGEHDEGSQERQRVPRGVRCCPWCAAPAPPISKRASAVLGIIGGRPGTIVVRGSAR